MTSFEFVKLESCNSSKEFVIVENCRMNSEIVNISLNVMEPVDTMFVS